jgi:hypothetical protein
MAPFCDPMEAAAIANPLHHSIAPSQRVMPEAVMFYEVIEQTTVKREEK